MDLLQPRLLLAAFIGAVLIAICAQLTINLPGVPVTLQSLVVLVVAFRLRRPAGWMAVMLYVLLGVIGLPVFAKGAAGVEVLKGNTGGYLIGFVAAAYVMTLFAWHGWNQSFGKILAAMVVGTAVIVAFGFVRLYIGFGLERALMWGFFQLIPGALIKIFAGAGICWALERWKGWP
jgi:biotin transport system substrate-specific component